MKELIIVGESYFDREILGFLVQKYCDNKVQLKYEGKHTNKTSVLKDFKKYKSWAIHAQKADMETYIIFSCDLDFDGNCISEFLEKEKIFPLEFSSNFLFTIQVREIESWILSDPIGLEKWTKIPRKKLEDVPLNFDISEKSTKTLLRIASKNNALKNILCHSKDSQKKSEYYNEELFDFIKNFFDAERARKNNKSLNRFLMKLETGFVS